MTGTLLLPPHILPTAITRIESPIGRLEVHTRSGAVTRLDIEHDGALPCEHLVETSSTLHDEIKRQLDEYFAGRRTRFDLPLEQPGTIFHTEVWRELGRIPWGSATTYGELAAATGRPTGARAIGGAVRANQIALLVPCHRVLGSGRRITGYSAGNGVATKAWLLRHENIDFVPASGCQ